MVEGRRHRVTPSSLRQGLADELHLVPRAARSSAGRRAAPFGSPRTQAPSPTRPARGWSRRGRIERRGADAVPCPPHPVPRPGPAAADRRTAGARLRSWLAAVPAVATPPSAWGRSWLAADGTRAGPRGHPRGRRPRRRTPRRPRSPRSIEPTGGSRRHRVQQPEPCASPRSRPAPCARLILDARACAGSCTRLARAGHLRGGGGRSGLLAAGARPSSYWPSTRSGRRRRTAIWRGRERVG